MTTTEEYNVKSARSKKMLLWFAMISMIMVFAGLTSAYVVSKSNRSDWKPFEMPSSFFISTAVMLVSSVTFHFSKKAMQKGNRSLTSVLLWVTLVLGVTFVWFQYHGFAQLFGLGLFPAGSYATITVSFLWVLVLTHLAHLSGGLISLLVIIYNHFKQKYSPSQTLGIELGAMFWHFLDFLWLYLFLFLYFFK